MGQHREWADEARDSALGGAWCRLDRRRYTAEHITGDKISVPERCQIDGTYSSIDPFSDETGRFVSGATTHFVKDFFGVDCGLHKCRLDRAGSHLKQLALGAFRQIESKKKEVKALLGSPGDVKLCVRQRRLREEALEKARGAMQKRPRDNRSLALIGPKEPGST